MSCQCTYNQKFWVLFQMWVPVLGAIPPLSWQYHRKGLLGMTHGMILARSQQAGVHERLWHSLILSSCDKWAKTTLPSPLPATDFPEQIWNKSVCQGHATGWTHKNVQCFYKNTHFLLSYIASPAKITLAIRTEEGTKVGVLDLTLAIIHTNSCPRILALHNPIYTNMFL